MHVTLRVCFLEPLEYCLSFAETGMDERRRIRRHVSLAGNGRQDCQDLASFVDAPTPRENIAPQRDRLAVATREPRRIRERFQQAARGLGQPRSNRTGTARADCL